MTAPNISRLGRFLSLWVSVCHGELWASLELSEEGTNRQSSPGRQRTWKKKTSYIPGKLQSLPFPGQEQKSSPCQKRCLLPTSYQELPGLPQPQPQHRDGTSFPNEGLKSLWSLLDHTSEWAGQPHLLPVGTSVVPLEEVRYIDLEEGEQGRREQRSRQRRRSGHGLEVGGHSSQHIGRAQQRSRGHSNRILSA